MSCFNDVEMNGEVMKRTIDLDVRNIGLLWNK